MQFANMAMLGGGGVVKTYAVDTELAGIFDEINLMLPVLARREGTSCSRLLLPSLKSAMAQVLTNLREIDNEGTVRHDDQR